MSNNLFSKYTFLARLLPALLLLSPILLPVSVLFLTNDSLPEYFYIFSTSMLVIIITAAVFTTRHLGKKLEKKLFAEWDGAPTTRFLRICNNEYPEIDKKIIKNFLRNFISTMIMPSKIKEKQDKKSTDVIYASYIRIIRQLTRDKRKFEIIYNENVSYGMWRNLYAIKKIMIVSWSICIAVSFLLCYLNPISYIINFSLMWIITSILNILVWVYCISKKNVKQAAEDYAKELLNATLLLAIENNEQMRKEIKQE